jgi:mediator of RNA polymerase II transcription subunit 7
MAEQQPANTLAAAFPTPPPFYQHFTTENLDRIAALRAEKQETNTASSGPSDGPSDPDDARLPLRILDLPPELRFLQPPEPPAAGIYRSFGDIFNVI